jgi:DNA polymerase III subunit epsilon
MGIQDGTPQFAVVDVETTGVGNKDRIVEVAVVVLDENLAIVDEYDTLIDPMRDVGPIDVHGITPSMLANAPTFEEVSAAVRDRIHDRVLVAHNLVFDQRMIRNEYARLHAELIPGTGVCTLRQTGETLSLACKTYGVELESCHRALADARATAGLLQRVFEDSPETESARVENLTYPLNPRTLRREANSNGELPVLARLVSATRYPTSEGALLSYLNALDWVLDDLVVTDEERSHLEDLIDELGLTAEDVADANSKYLASMIRAAWRDEIITKEENWLIQKVAELLNVRDFDIPEVTEAVADPSSIAVGTRVCFTGTAVDQHGNKISRSDLESIAANAGLQPVSSVTKKNCDLLVAADPSTQSGKAGNARKYGIPIFSVDQFLNEMLH